MVYRHEYEGHEIVFWPIYSRRNFWTKSRDYLLVDGHIVATSGILFSGTTAKGEFEHAGARIPIEMRTQNSRHDGNSVEYKLFIAGHLVDSGMLRLSFMWAEPPDVEAAVRALPAETLTAGGRPGASIPKRFEVIEEGGQTILRRRWFQPLLLTIVVPAMGFMLVWDGMVSSFCMSMIAQGTFSALAFMIPFLVPGIGMVYFLLGAMLNKTDFLISTRGVRVRTYPFLWPGDREYLFPDGVHLRSVGLTRSRSGGKGNDFGVQFTDSNGRTYRLGKRLLIASEDAEFIKGKIWEKLGIAEGPAPEGTADRVGAGIEGGIEAAQGGVWRKVLAFRVTIDDVQRVLAGAVSLLRRPAVCGCVLLLVATVIVWGGHFTSLKSYYFVYALLLEINLAGLAALRAPKEQSEAGRSVSRALLWPVYGFAVLSLAAGFVMVANGIMAGYVYVRMYSATACVTQGTVTQVSVPDANGDVDVGFEYETSEGVYNGSAYLDARNSEGLEEGSLVQVRYVQSRPDAGCLDKKLAGYPASSVQLMLGGVALMACAIAAWVRIVRLRYGSLLSIGTTNAFVA